MQRRQFTQFALLAPLASLGACSASVPDYWDWPEADLLAALGQRFPRDFPVAGLLKASLAQPEIQLLPQNNQIHALLQVAFSGPALGRTYAGSTAVRFGLRFEPQDSSVRAHNVQVEHLRLNGAPAPVAEMLNAYGPYLAEKIFQDWALYQLDEKQRQQLRRWEITPQAISVTAQGLRVHLKPQ